MSKQVYAAPVAYIFVSCMLNVRKIRVVILSCYSYTTVTTAPSGQCRMLVYIGFVTVSKNSELFAVQSI